MNPSHLRHSYPRCLVGSGLYCVHLYLMFLLPYPRCVVRPSFDFVGEKRATFCDAHKMVSKFL